MIEHPFVVRDDPKFEVAPTVGLGPQPRAREIGAAEVKKRAVDRDQLQVDAWTRPHLEARTGETRCAMNELVAKRRGWNRCVKEANGDAPVAQRLDRVEDGHVPPPCPVPGPDGRLDEQLFDVGRGDPHGGSGARDAEGHALVVGPIRDERDGGASRRGEPFVSHVPHDSDTDPSPARFRGSNVQRMS